MRTLFYKIIDVVSDTAHMTKKKYNNRNKKKPPPGYVMRTALAPIPDPKSAPAAPGAK
jgi:hypothetical protein